MLAAIYWWYLRNFIFLFIPLLTFFDKKLRPISPFVFFSLALYCVLLEYNYKKIQNKILGFHSTLLVKVDDIYFNEIKNTYKITGIAEINGSKKAARIQLFSKTKPLFNAGDNVEFKNLNFNKITNPEYSNYLLKENIHATTYCNKLLSTKKKQIKTKTINTKEISLQIENQISNKMSNIAGNLFSSLFLGSKKYIECQDLTIKNCFNTWGINHFLARSGLHVTLILFFIIFMGRICLIPFNYLNLITSFFLLAYSLFSYSSISFFRAFITALMGIWCLTMRVPLNSLHLVTLAFLISIIYNPFFALFLDFQLTFLLTWGLCVLASLDF
ncbi:MAG: ComEC/Rec2 family competence protein [Candidatus Babeliaceae bacterium]|nr:ComEC/Rec2 family competence protein [Candidatus Babeliaceae bacterium]